MVYMIEFCYLTLEQNFSRGASLYISKKRYKPNGGYKVCFVPVHRLVHSRQGFPEV